ncbi:putative pyruvate kinase [Helianthus anomalus]
MLDLLLFCRQSAKIIVTCNKVHGAIKVKASVIICFTSTGRAARCTESTGATNETILKVALDHGRNIGVIKPHDRVVGCQKVGDDFVVKIIELENTS